MTKVLKLTHKELVFLVSDLVVEAQKGIAHINEQNTYSTSNTSPGPLQLLQAIVHGGKRKSAQPGSPMAKQVDEYYRRNRISGILNSKWNEDIVTPEFLKVLKRTISQKEKDNPQSLWSMTKKLYPTAKDLWIDQQVILELFVRQQRKNKEIGFKDIMGYNPDDEQHSPEASAQRISNERNNILKSGGYLGLTPIKMIEKLFSQGKDGNISAIDVDAVFSTLVADSIDLRAIMGEADEFKKWQTTSKQQKKFFSEFPNLTANMGIPDELSDGVQDLIDLYQAPFKNRKEGNAFRSWMKEVYPNWRGSGDEPLDKKGSYRNTYVNQAWRDHGVQYTDVTKEHELLSYEDWLEKSRLKDNSQMRSYYKGYLKGESYKHDDIEHGEYINPTAPIYTVTDPLSSDFQDYDSDGWFSCLDCHAFVGNGYAMGRRPNEGQQMFMASNGLNYPAYQAQMDNAWDVVANFSDYLLDVPVVMWFTDGGYHLLVDVCSFVCYIICPVTYGVGCAASVGFDILNAYAYVNWDDEKDYYSAGLQLAFAIVPGGEFIKILAKPLKPFLTEFFGTILKSSAKPTEKWVAEQVAKMAPATKQAFKEIIGPYAHLFPSKAGVAAMETQLNGWLRAIKPYCDNTIFSMAKKIKDWALRNFRWWVILVEQVMYDPGQSLFTLIGDVSNKYVPWLGLQSYTDKLKDWNKHGLSFYNWMLERYDFGGMEAIVQTSIDGCTNKVYSSRYSQSYTWESVKEEWLNSETSSADPYTKEKNYWKSHKNNQKFIDKAKRESESGFKTKEKNNLRNYPSSVTSMEEYVYTPINGEWHRKLKGSSDEWVNMTTTTDLWDENKFRDDWLGRGWRPKSEVDPDFNQEETKDTITNLSATIFAMLTYNKFKTCEEMTNQSEFKKYFDDCKLFINMWVNGVEQDSEENKIRTSMDLVWFKNCK